MKFCSSYDSALLGRKNRYHVALDMIVALMHTSYINKVFVPDDIHSVTLTTQYSQNIKFNMHYIGTIFFLHKIDFIINLLCLIG